ncbi:FUSC family protein [Streptacidiphilus sp. N1-3]|uniref:FUSC family protein n=1 Tax=Streptacidiphilus alkalitolerans TaxID=3342712 RepID=A0ABV6XBL4_9ACTN
MEATRVPLFGRARETWDDLWDRFSASDPGLIRLTSGLTTVGAVVATLAVLAALHTAVPMLVVGALCAMVASFAISDPGPREQAVTLALGVPTAFAVISCGALLARYRVAADLLFLLLIFAAVYVRRYGPRGTGLGLIAFQLFFVSQFAHVTPSMLPQLYGVLGIAFGVAAVVRFGLVRATPERTLGRLRRAFRARLADLVDALEAAAEAAPGTPAADRAAEDLRRRTGRLHACALMIQARLESGLPDAHAASLLQRRIAEAEIAAERLGILLLRVLRPQQRGGQHNGGQDNAVTLGLYLPELLPGAKATDPGLEALVAELHSLRFLVARSTSEARDAGFTAVRDRLLDYRDDQRIPEVSDQVRDVYRAIGDLARAMLGLRLAFGAEPEAADTPADSPEGARTREELGVEDLLLGAEDEDAPPQTGLDRPTTRAAWQVTTGSALAVLGGELLSSQRWYWAVLTCWVVFLNTSSIGEILVKGYRRLLGTVVGVLAGVGLAALVGNDTWTAFTLVILCIFGMFFTAPLSYTLMSFFVTAMIGLLYTLLHTYSEAVLVLRIEETALGAACGLVAAVLVLPVHTRRRTDEQLVTVLLRLRQSVTLSVAQLAGAPAADLLDATRDLDTALDAFRSSIQPLTHPASPLRDRRRRARYVLGILETCAFHSRSLAATAGLLPDTLLPDALGVRADPRLADAGRRLARNLDTLVAFLREGDRGLPPLEPGPSVSALVRAAPGAGPDRTVALRVLRHLQRLDEGVLALARPLGLPAGPDPEPAEPVTGTD